jgi:four helix bundle protein
MPTTRGSDEQLAWERACAAAITSDVLWKLDAYRASMYLLHVAQEDSRAICARHPGDEIARQLLRSAGSVGANLGEGYSRSTRADRLRFLSYALGSTRECVVWYQAASDVITGRAYEQRLHLLMRIRSLLIGVIRSNRERTATAATFEP